MLNFDFSEAKLKKWDTILPWGGPLFMEEVGWDQGTFLAHFYMLNDPKGFKVDQERVFNVFRLKCKPEFALLVKDEVYGLSLSHELGSKENDKIRGHAIVEDSLWISSFLKSEPYAASFSKLPILHYIVFAGNDFVHLLSSDIPHVTSLGRKIAEDSNWESCVSMMEKRMDSRLQ